MIVHLSPEQVQVLRRIIDGKKIFTEVEALAALIQMADVQLEANGINEIYAKWRISNNCV